MARARSAAKDRAAGTVRPALVRDMTASSGAGSVELDFDARTSFEFLVSLSISEEPELLPDDAAWLASAHAGLSESLRRDMRRVFCPAGSDEMGLGFALMPLVVADPDVRTAADVVALAARLDVKDLIVGATCEMADHAHRPADHGRALDLTGRALAGDEAARDELLDQWPDKVRPMLTRVLADPDGEVRAVRRVLRAWAERFATVEERVARMLAHDVAARRREIEGLSVTDAVEHVTGGIRFARDAGLTRVILAPSYFARPYNYLFGENDWRMYCYPIEDASLDADPAALPSATVRLFKALGDETRLRILRLLAGGDLYLTEIADRLGLTKPTVSHHMVLLRAAGLVTVTEARGLTYYTLRRERLGDASGDLARLIGA